MSDVAILLRDRLFAVLSNEIETYTRVALSIRNPTKATSDEIAFVILEANAARRVLELARKAVLDEYVKLVTPDSIPSGVGEEENTGDAFYS